MMSFVLVLVVTYLMSILVYGFVSRQYIVKQTRNELYDIAESVEDSMAKLLERNADTRSVSRSLKLIQELELFNQVLGTKAVLLNEDSEIVYPRDGWNQERLKNLINTAKLDNESQVVIKHTITTDGIPFDSIVLYKKFEDVRVFRALGIRSLLISFVAGSLFALVIGLYQSQKIYKPIKELKTTMQSYMKNKTEVQVNYSNDEIEELSLIFKQLTDKINNLDMRQKQFFQNSSHELKTPLMSIQGYVEAIKDGIVTGDEQEKSLDIIISETQRLKNIVDDVIYLSKVDSLEENFMMNKHNLSELILDAKKVVMPLLIASELEFEINCDKSIEFNCDYDKIKRVFINLISNGSRYAKTKIVVNATLQQYLLVVDVIDDGEGFEYGQEVTVFDRFYKGKQGGSGIGLALTKEIVEKHGGQIKAINHLNYGAVFNMEFPIT